MTQPLATILVPVATLASQSTAVVQKEDSLRLYRTSTVVQATAETVEAIRALLLAGHTVRVFEGTIIYYPTIADDGVLVWRTRKTTKDRSKVRACDGVMSQRGYSVVEVAL